MKKRDLKEELEKAFQEKLKAQISLSGELSMSGILVEIKKFDILSTTLHPDSLDFFQLLEQSKTNLHFAGMFEVYFNGEYQDFKSNEFYNFESFGVNVVYNPEEKKFEFESDITLSNLNKR